MRIAIFLIAWIFSTNIFSAWSTAEQLSVGCQRYLEYIDSGDKEAFGKDITAGHCFGAVEAVAFTLGYMKNEGMLREDIFCPPEASITDLIRYIVVFIHKNPEIKEAPAAEVIQHALTTGVFKCGNRK